MAAVLGGILQWMQDHERHDDTRFLDGKKKMETLVTKDDLADFAKLFVELDDVGEVRRDPGTGHLIPKFATKKDVQPVIKFYDKLALSAQIVGGGSKFLSSATFWLAAILIAIGVISGKIWVVIGILGDWMHALSGK